MREPARDGERAGESRREPERDGERAGERQRDNRQGDREDQIDLI